MRAEAAVGHIEAVVVHLVDQDVDHITWVAVAVAAVAAQDIFPVVVLAEAVIAAVVPMALVSQGCTLLSRKYMPQPQQQLLNQQHQSRL